MPGKSRKPPRKRGHPPGKPEELKSEKVSLNFTRSELARIDQAAAKVFLDRGILGRQAVLRVTHEILGLEPPTKK